MPSITTPISRVTRPSRHESSSIIGSTRDSGMNSKQWQKNKRDSENQNYSANALSKMQQDIAKMRRVKAGGYMPTDNPTIFPFKIYQSGADNQFQVRGGYIGYRGNYLLPSTNIAGTRNYYNANNELVLFGCGTDSQGSGALAYDGYVTPPSTSLYDALESNSGTPITIDGLTDIDTPVLICSNQPSTPNPLGVSVILENSDTARNLFFWVVIKDSETDGPYTELWAGYSDLLSSLTKGDMISTPDSASGLFYEIIPVGCVRGGDFVVSQYQSENLLNRYNLPSHRPQQASYQGSVSYDMPQRWRGKWSADMLLGSPSSILTFAGDIVIDDRYSATVTGIGSVRMAYMKLPNSAGATIMDDISNAPSSAFGTAGTNWLKFTILPY